MVNAVDTSLSVKSR